MKLEKLKLVNFCQHKDFECSFSPGLNGIIGVNGAGKSNILEAIKYAITGNSSYPIDNYVTIGHEDGPSSVQLDFSDETGQQHFSITRTIKPTRSAVLVTPTSQIRGVNNINAYLQDEFGVDFDLVKNIQVVSQSEWVAMFKLPAAARATLLQRIFACDFLKSKRDTLRQFILSVTASTSVQDSIKAYTEILNEKKYMLTAYSDLPEITVADTQLAILKNSRAKVEEARNTIKYCDAVKTELDKINKYLDAHSDFVPGKTFDIQAASERKVAAQRTMDERSTQVRDLDIIVDSSKAIFEMYDYLIRDFNTYLELKEQHNHLKGVRDAKQRELEALRYACYMTEHEHRIDCPICGHAFSKDERDAVLDEWYERQKKINLDMSEIVSTEQHVMELHRASHGTFVRISDSIRALPATIYSASMLDECIPTQGSYTLGNANACLFPDSEACKKKFGSMINLLKQGKAHYLEEQANAIAAYEKACDEYSAMCEEYEAYTKLSANIEVARSKKAENEKYLEKFGTASNVSLEELERTLVTLNEEVDKAYKTVNDINTKMSIERDIKSLEERIAECEKQLTNLVTLADRRQVLENVVSILSPDKFPRAVVLGWLRILESSINTYLEAFNASYKAVVRDNTDIYCDFPDGKSIPSWSLSGGQQVVLAIAWRLALHNTFARSEACGFLTLDEPTTFLDKDNIDNLVSVMGNIKAIADNNNLQILVITHSQALSPLFDTVIEL